MGKVVKINQKQEKELMEDLISRGYYIAKLDGRAINITEEYMLAIDKAFGFPKGIFKNIDNFDAYLDWMTDLSWLGEQKGYALFISDYSTMMPNYPEDKEIIMECFTDMIYFWEKDIVRCLVGGKVKEFKVFLED